MPAPEFLDTNVLVYAYDPSDSRKQRLAQDLVRRAVAGDREARRNRSSTNTQPQTDDRIPHLVAHLTLRTRQIRESASSMTGSMIGALGNHLSQKEVGTALFAKELSTDGKIREGFKKLLLDNGLPPGKLDDVMQQLEPNWKEVAANLMSILGDQYPTMIAEQIKSFETMRPEAMKGGFIDSYHGTYPCQRE